MTTGAARSLDRRLRRACLIAVVFTTLAWASSACQSTSPQHPRLFFSAGDIGALRASATTTKRSIWQPIGDYAAAHGDGNASTSAPADGDLDTYRNTGNELIALAFACVINNGGATCDLAKRSLLAYTTWNQWGNANERDLGLAHMLTGNALAYDWLYDRLTEREREHVRASLGGWAEKMYEASDATETDEAWHNWWRKAYAQNHMWTNYSALGMAGLALLNEDDRAQKWIDRARERLEHVRDLLNGIADGSWHEGMSYQSYGLTMLLPFLFNLRKIQQRDIFPHTYLRNYTYWRLYNHLPGTTQFILAYGDFEQAWGNSYQAQNILRFNAGEYRDNNAEWMAQQLVAADPRTSTVWAVPWYVFEFLYYDPTIAAQPPTQLPPTRVFPDLGGVVWRGGWGKNDLVFGLKAGAFGGEFAYKTFTQGQKPWEPPCITTGCALHIGHEHDDANSFYLFSNGRWQAPEVWGVDKQATALHNTILIDGQGQYRPPLDHYDKYPADFADSDGKLEATASTSHFDYLAADATRRYKNISGITAATRHVVFVRPGYLLMLDALASSEPHRYEWVGHFSERVSLDERWMRGDAGDGQVLGVFTAAPQSFTTQIGDDGFPFVHVGTPWPVNDLRFIHAFYPTSEGGWASRPTVTVLEDDRAYGLVQIRANEAAPRVDDVLVNYSAEAGEVVGGTYRYNGRVAVVSRGEAGAIERMFAYGGTVLQDENGARQLVAGLRSDAPFEVVFSGETASVEYTAQATITLYAPHVTRLLVNATSQVFTRSGDFITFATQR